MRCASYALSAVILVAGQAVAAEPGPPKPTPKPAVSPTPAVAPAATPKAGAAPPSEYYVEPSVGGPEPSASAPPSSAAPGAPPAMTGEPPPPPEPHHVAPRTALWLSARVGWFIPFGNVWARRTSNTDVTGVPWRDYASSGPMFELDVGARLARNYAVFALWERAQLGGGKGDSLSSIPGKADHGDTDFWGVGLRATSDPDHTGFVTELAIGYRRARSKYDDGSQLQLTDAPFEARLGVGADIRLNRIVTLSPMFTLGVGSFGKVESVTKAGIQDETRTDDQADGHAWATLTMGGSFDLLGTKH